MRPWYKGCAEPCQGSERGSNPLGRSILRACSTMVVRGVDNALT
jgi:hypothetical protein